MEIIFKQENIQISAGAWNHNFNINIHDLLSGKKTNLTTNQWTPITISAPNAQGRVSVKDDQEIASLGVEAASAIRGAIDAWHAETGIGYVDVTGRYANCCDNCKNPLKAGEKNYCGKCTCLHDVISGKFSF